MQDAPNIKATEKYKSLFYRDGRKPAYTTTMMSYDDYLQTDVWKEIRFTRLKMDHFKCQQCGSGINVQVHHIRYPESAWGTENLKDDLVTLCDLCHKETHE